jgi:hypothetical protein
MFTFAVWGMCGCLVSCPVLAASLLVAMLHRMLPPISSYPAQCLVPLRNQEEAADVINV